MTLPKNPSSKLSPKQIALGEKSFQEMKRLYPELSLRGLEMVTKIASTPPKNSENLKKSD